MSILKSLKRSLTVIPLAGAMLLSSMGVNAELGDSLLKSGIDNEDVKILQNQLVEMKFLEIDETTTYYGDATVQAVKDFQNFYGLSEDGAFGPDTFETFTKVLVISPLEYIRTLEVGLDGEDVQALQERLQIMGFLGKDDIDSDFGSKTKQAVSDFQELYKLQVDGKAGSETIDTINKALNGNKRMKRPIATRSGLGGTNGNLISTAKKYIGTPYSFGGTSSSGFDCAGFTQMVYRTHGISVPRTSASQAGVGTKLSRCELQTGDLVVFSNTYKQGPSHVGIYIGNSEFIHASSVRGVTISSLNENYYTNHFSYGRKVN